MALHTDSLISPLELSARAKLAEIPHDAWSPDLAAVRNVFTACWSSALSAAQISTISSALNSTVDTSEAWVLQVTRKLVKLGVLRSRDVRGVRLYEVAI